MHTVSYEFLMKPEESARCHQTLSSRVGAGHETSSPQDDSRISPEGAMFVYYKIRILALPSLRLRSLLAAATLREHILMRKGASLSDRNSRPGEQLVIN